ncbi:MAG: TonB-dependent receptor [Rhodanobacter sp.]|jgi:iron complex outermembrane receptor protein
MIVARRRPNPRHPLSHAISRLLAPSRCALLLGMVLAGAAHAADVAAPAGLPDGTVVKQLTEVEVRADVVKTAQTQAFTQSELDVLQPQSVIGLDYISNHVAATSDYASIAAIAPAVANVSPAGPGLGESKQMTLRGFSDNQYNVTYDGIPFGDNNDFSHHTSSYFPAKVLGQIVIDRGPGGASQLGQATFGGTVALFSKDATNHFSFIPTVSVGSYGTTLTHLELNSGRIDSLHGGKLIVSAQYNDTDTAQTYSPMNRKTGYIKYVQPIGNSTELTFLSNYNYITFNKPNKGSLTTSEIATLGRDYGLTNDPTSVDYYGYNYQTKETDLEYAGISSQLSDSWHLDDKFYTYAYANTSHESAFKGTVTSPNAMGGYIKINNYRAWGDTFRLSHRDDAGELRLGGWYEWLHNDRSSRAIDYANGEQLNVKPGKTALSAYKYLMHDSIYTTQLFTEYAWNASDDLVIVPGVKYFNARRTIDAPSNQTTKLPLNYGQSWDKVLGYLSANYRLTDSWSTYAQAAQGFLTPNLNQFYVVDPAVNKAKPQQTMNYQLGTVYKTDRLDADMDVYYIDYQNFPITQVDPVTNEDIYILASGARMSGVEAEATYYMGKGLSVFANGSISRAKFKRSGLDVPNVPNSTAALGGIFEQNGFFASLTEKYVGPQKVYNGSFNPDVFASVTDTGQSGGFWRAAMSVGYGQNLAGTFIKSYKLRLQVDNLFDARQNVADSLKKGSIYYLVLPGRSWFASVSMAF